MRIRTVLVKEAVKQHLGNFRMPDFITDLNFREQKLPYDSGFSSANISPYSVCKSIRKDVAIYAVSGWMDGVGYANSAIARYLTMQGNPTHLLLGPWDHGARCNVSPWRGRIDPEFALLGELLRFFDEYLMGRTTGLREESPVHFFSPARRRPGRKRRAGRRSPNRTRLHLAAARWRKQP
jgi:putative CocE/NonD family hydrolase